MTRGERVIRVSLAKDEGHIGDTGTIEKVFEFDHQAFGYRVIWDDKPTVSQYVAPMRIEHIEQIEVP